MVQLNEGQGLEMAGPTRLELATSGVTGRRSNQLNYGPALILNDLDICCLDIIPVCNLFVTIAFKSWATCLRSFSLVMLYLSNTLRVLLPVIFIAIVSGTPTLTKFLTAVRLKSWGILPAKPTFLQAWFQDLRKSPTLLPLR